MPSSNLQKLIAKYDLTLEDWISLIEERRAMIKPHLDRFTLKKLGDFGGCLRNGKVTSHIIRVDSPNVVTHGEPTLSLETQAIWGGDNDCLKHLGRVEGAFCQSKWGLTRAGQWALAFVYSRQERNHPQFGYYERAFLVEVSVVELPDLLTQSNRSPGEIWRGLTGPVRSWLQNIDPVYTSIQTLADTFEQDEKLYRTLTR